MKPLTTVTRLTASLTLAALLTGCGDSSLTRTFGLVRDAPDEFTVVTRAPLSLPPDFTLRPPQPGAPRPQEQGERALAEAALVPEAALGPPRTALTPGQAALVRAAGGTGAADIRRRVDEDARTLTSEDGFIDRLLYWRKADPQRQLVDAPKEAQRLKANAASGQPPAAGETPVIRERKTGWFQSLFSWL